MDKILVIDNFDSFTYNLVHLLRELSDSEVVVVRNNAITVGEAANFGSIVLSPGPGIPLEAGVMPQVVKELASTKKILGVCLGHQCIGEVFGAKLENLPKVFHGKEMNTHLKNVCDDLFKGLPSTFPCGRYHSWVVSKENFPKDLEITAEDDSGYIMSLRHREFRVKGVQYHPESVLTPLGPTIIKNWLAE